MILRNENSVIVTTIDWMKISPWKENESSSLCFDSIIGETMRKDLEVS